MEQRSNNAALRIAQIKLSKEECASGMGHIAIKTMNLLHSDQSSSRLLLLNLNPMSVHLNLPSQDREDGAYPKRWPSQEIFEV